MPQWSPAIRLEKPTLSGLSRILLLRAAHSNPPTLQLSFISNVYSRTIEISNACCNRMKYCISILYIAFVCLLSPVHSQSISGVVNSYYHVISVNNANNKAA
jgi:hypothetical protein